jgi:uncharacterized protein YndB with AHSA1/START domain
MDHEVRIDIAAPAARVWSVLSDVERWPEWTASVRSVELLDGTLAVGNRVRIRQPRFPTVVWEVTEVVPNRSFTWRSRGPGADAIGSHAVADNGDGSSTAVLGISQTGLLGTLVALLSRPLTKRYVALEAAGLKQRSEQPAAEPT